MTLCLGVLVVKKPAILAPVAHPHRVRDAAEGDDGGVRPSPAAAMS